MRTAAQTLSATLGLDTAGVLDGEWKQSLSLAGSAAVLVALAAITASGSGDGPGLAEIVRTRT
ncbi:holin [Streptomyces sp. NPDC058239]|uniref:holin n=1 Tax=Streptomyces sp. NPDC058239 TaxID=3346395 RepID=UPI0036F08D90